MTKDIINVQYPISDATQSVAATGISKTAVDPDKGVSIKKAFANKNNTLMVCVENTAQTDSKVTFLAGDAFPNAMLGNLEQDLLAKTTTVFQLQDISRFENKDGSLNLDFPSGFSGNVFAIAKSVALNV
ncbi:hypothetical protein J6O48_02380 [bacterium]|nr:hypothetical protein [bacterium]